MRSSKPVPGLPEQGAKLLQEDDRLDAVVWKEDKASCVRRFSQLPAIDIKQNRLAIGNGFSRMRKAQPVSSACSTTNATRSSSKQRVIS